MYKQIKNCTHTHTHTRPPALIGTRRPTRYVCVCTIFVHFLYFLYFYIYFIVFYIYIYIYIYIIIFL